MKLDYIRGRKIELGYNGEVDLRAINRRGHAHTERRVTYDHADTIQTLYSLPLLAHAENSLVELPEQRAVIMNATRFDLGSALRLAGQKGP